MMDRSGDEAVNLQSPWSLEKETVLEKLEADGERGLSESEANRRLQKYGSNLLRRHKKRSFLSILWDQFKSIIIALLVAAALFAFWLGEFIDGMAIVVVILLNTLIGFFTELRAVRSMEALFKLGEVKTRVLRDGSPKEIDAEKLVPGDIVLFEGGDIITADLRIIDSSKLQADESALTGESLPIEKKDETVAEDCVLAERSSMLYKGTAVTRGAGEGVVVATGLETELGHISSLVEEAEEEQTPLQERLDKLGYRLIGVTLLIAAIVIGSGILAGKDLYLMVETGIALAVAAIPEGLPIVATIALAKGVRVMAEKNALVNRLSSVETLGSTGVICTDKTGTLTENRMTVTKLFLPEKGQEVDAKEYQSEIEQGDSESDPDLKLAFEIGVLCNNASLNQDKDGGTGDPLEVALLQAAHDAGMDLEEISARYPEEREEAFDPEVKMMATWNRNEDGLRVNVKGAPGAVLKACNSIMIGGSTKELDDKQRRYWQEVNEELAAKGLRIIGFAVKHVQESDGDPYQDLSWVGLVALSDPPRTDIKPSIEQCYRAGIRVVMVTGDQVATARYIAESIGLKNSELVIHGSDLPANGKTEKSNWSEASVFARISPQQKLNLIDMYQKEGHIVAMTGDGVNDAPALKKADIGIAMGQRGTQVAREASDMVLTDDAFSTIVTAIEQGRVIFGNIRRFIYYLMSCNVSEVMVVGLASLLGTVLPILPLQILFLNLVTDVFPALALGVGEGEEGIMKRQPRDPKQPVLGRSQWLGIAAYGFLITISVLGALYIALQYLELPAREAVTISFLTLAMAQLWHVFNMIGPNADLFDNSITRNPYIWGALVLCVGLLLLAVYVPAVAAVLEISPPDIYGWSTILGMSVIPLFLGQLRRIRLLGE